MPEEADLKDKILSLPRQDLLKLIARGMNDLTIFGRSYYHAPDELLGLRTVNEAMHRLSGHLRDLCDRDEPCTDSRAEGIVGNLAVLPDGSLKRLYEFTT